MKESNIIKKGDHVLRLNMKKRTKKGHKTEDTWIGPYKVVEVTKYGSVKLQCLKTNEIILKSKVNIGQLKAYHGCVEGNNNFSVTMIHMNSFTLCL